MPSTPCRVAFFSLPAQRKEPKERAALPLRRPRSTGCGTGGARTRCAQTACPFFPVPHPAARLSAKGLFASPETRPAPNRPLGGASALHRGREVWCLDRSHVNRWRCLLPPFTSGPAGSVDRGREGRLSSRSPLPPNRTGGFPASGSPVSGFHSGTGGRPRRLQQA